MAKKTTPKGKVSVRDLRREVNKVLKKISRKRTTSAGELRMTLKTFKVDIDCGQTLYLDITR